MLKYLALKIKALLAFMLVLKCLALKVSETITAFDVLVKIPIL